MTHEARMKREAAVIAEIQRLRAFAETGAYLPVEVGFEHIDVEGLAFVINGYDSPGLQTVARVAWYPERKLEGDREVGRPYAVIEELQVWAAVDGPGLPMREITRLLGASALVDIAGYCEEHLGARLREREAA